MRRLLVAAAVSLASASEPFSWADAQNAMHACTNGSRPLVDKYAYLSTRHPLGNALSGWMHVFMYALASGRQPVVGSGTAPRLLCGREGAFSCGVPFVNDARTLGSVRRMVGRNGAPFSDRTTDVLASDAAQGYQWHNVGWLSNLGGPHYVQCARRALRCVGGASGLDDEACAMARAMQLLLPGADGKPGPSLRPAFAAAAIREAEHYTITHSFCRGRSWRRVVSERDLRSARTVCSRHGTPPLRPHSRRLHA
jgi:hypothetical protein